MDTFFNILQSISIIIAAGVTIYGIADWRREATWKRKYELAEEVLSLFYECEEKINIIRSPFGHSQEGKTRLRSETETQKESEILDNAYVFYERYENEKDPFIKLWTLKYRFMVVFGKETGKSFDDLRIILNKILLAARRIGEIFLEYQRYPTHDQKEIERRGKRLEENQAIVWGDNEETDLIAKDVHKIVESIEEVCISIKGR